MAISKKDDENVTAGISWHLPSEGQPESTWNCLHQRNWAIVWHIYSTDTVFIDFLFLVFLFTDILLFTFTYVRVWCLLMSL